MIKTETEKNIKELGKKYNLKLIMLFGSAARNKENIKSDIDIAIMPSDKNFYENDFSNFNYDLMEAENIEKKEIEVIPISNENPILLYNIFNDGIPLYMKNEQEFSRIKSWARFSYEDNKRFFYGRETLLQRRLAKLKTK